jgi:hypothetical protein
VNLFGAGELMDTIDHDGLSKLRDWWNFACIFGWEKPVRT